MSKYHIQNYQILKVLDKGTYAIVQQAQNIRIKEFATIDVIFIMIDNLEGIYKQQTLKLLESEIMRITKWINYIHICRIERHSTKLECNQSDVLKEIQQC
ncbi:unnamed protein product [Paramecium octaurelia]|uniref:Uncharacterized protein n=1 Tax=Paramecium octaurelia TaxID=43137 RepID=A0A8S1UNB1_PAROT|nr:unnamed protein product [Paramecium octaurelia]